MANDISLEDIAGARNHHLFNRFEDWCDDNGVDPAGYAEDWWTWWVCFLAGVNAQMDTIAHPKINIKGTTTGRAPAAVEVKPVDRPDMKAAVKSVVVENSFGAVKKANRNTRRKTGRR